MENEEIMMNETTEAMTDVEEPITETETNEEESSSVVDRWRCGSYLRRCDLRKEACHPARGQWRGRPEG